jgi:prevent-host-death family protein
MYIMYNSYEVLMLKLTTTEAREMLSELVSRAAFGDERVVLTRHGKEMAVIISMADLAKLEASANAAPPVGRTKALPADQRKEGLTRGRAAVRAMSTSASSAKVAGDEVEAEIAAARKARHRR